jgi:acyl-CoA-binding protein
MSDLNAAFEAAVKNSTSISERPDNATLLKIYALYKQATEGDNEAKKPSFTDMVGRAKWDAWEKLSFDVGQEAAQGVSSTSTLVNPLENYKRQSTRTRSRTTSTSRSAWSGRSSRGTSRCSWRRGSSPRRSRPGTPSS